MKSIVAFSLGLALCLIQPALAGNSDTLRNGKWIAMHLLGYTSDTDLDKLAQEIPSYSSKGINLIFLEVDYSFDFKSHPELRAPDKYITLEGARRFAKICRQNKIRVVPEFQSLGHQSWAQWTFSLLTVYPELDLTPGAFPGNKDIYCREWDPTNPRVNEIVFPIIEEIVNAFEADGLHIGMDEVFLLGSEKSPNTKGKDPAELYAQVVNEFHEYFVKKKGLELFMWGDRLIDAKKYPYGDWESSSNGTAPAVDRIPKDIVICDWHYGQREVYPSIPMFIEKGFKVLPCSYKDKEAAKALIKYSYRLNHPQMVGHMFTSWSSIPKDSMLLNPALLEGIDVIKEKKIWDVTIEMKSANADGSLSIQITSENKDLKIFYTIDGSTPDNKSLLYTQPINLTKSSVVKAIAYSSSHPAGDINTKSFVIHHATGKGIKFTIEPSQKYPLTGGALALVNGIASTNAFSDGQWAGFEGQDIEAFIDLKGKKDISQVEVNCYNDPYSWIYPATNAEVWTSVDGRYYQKAGSVSIEESTKAQHVPVVIHFPKVKASFVKIIIPKRIIPEGAPAGAGYPAWIFIDELAVK